MHFTFLDDFLEAADELKVDLEADFEADNYEAQLNLGEVCQFMILLIVIYRSVN